MFGLFLILPVFAIYGRELPGDRRPPLIGLAISIYGLTVGHVPNPVWRGIRPLRTQAGDRRRTHRLAAGSVIAALSTNIAESLPGVPSRAGAISAAVSAFIADSTLRRGAHKGDGDGRRSIGLTFAFSLVAAPPLTGLDWLVRPVLVDGGAGRPRNRGDNVGCTARPA